MKTRLLLALLALLLNPYRPSTKAQSSPAKAGAAEAARLELERKALGLLEEALAEAQGLKLLENRVRAQATAARLLWPRDAQAARAAFKAAADSLAAFNAVVDPEDPQFYQTAQMAMHLRGELVQAAGQFDAKLALEFLRTTRPAYAAALTAAGYNQAAQEQTLEMSLAGQVAAQDPRRALELAEESLGRAVTTGLMGVLGRLREKDPAAASKLAGEIVRKLRAEDLALNYEASAVAQQLLSLTTPVQNPMANSAGRGQLVVIDGGGRAPAPGGTAALLDQETRRELVELVLAATANITPNQGGGYNLFHALQTLIPELERYAPARAAALRRRAETLERGFNPQASAMRPYQEILRSGNVEALLEAAPKAPSELRDQLYTQAAWKAFNEGGDAERARQIIENVSNPQQRAQMRRNMEQQAQWRAAQQGNFAEARQMAARLPGEERVQTLLQLAGQASAAGDAQAARQMLEEARGLVEGQTRGQQQFSYRLQVAGAYAPLDAGASFELVEAAVARLDELLEAAAAVDGFGHDSFREGELRPQGGYVWVELIGQCAQTLALLAPNDFERASAAARKFRRAEARTAAQLALAQALLNTLAPAQSSPFKGRRRAVAFGRM